MEVLLVADLFPPSAGGLERHVERLARALAQRGHSVHVVACGTRRPDDLGGGYRLSLVSTRVASIPGAYQRSDRAMPPPWPDDKLVHGISSAASLNRPDVIHAHGWSEFAAQRTATSLGIPLVVTLHDYGLLCPLKTLFRDGMDCPHSAGSACTVCPGSGQSAVKRLSLAVPLKLQSKWGRRAATYIAVSEAVRDAHARRGRIPNALVIPNFIDDWIGSAPAQFDKHRILFIGPTSPFKGYEVLRSAFRMLRRDGMDVQLDVVGSDVGESADGIIHWGRLEGGALRTRFHESSLVAVPSLWQEPCPTVALEALSAGRPIVGFAVGGLRDIVRSGINGLLADTRDAGDLAAALRRLLLDDALRVSAGLAARTDAPRFFTDSVVPKIEQLYSDVSHR